jgi:WD40 repeat protein
MYGHSYRVTSVSFSPDGTRVSGSCDNNIQLWDAITGAHINTLRGHSDAVESVAFSPDSTRIVSGSYDTTLRLWDAVNGAQLDILREHFLCSYRYISQSFAHSLYPQQSSFLESVAKHITSSDSGRRVGYLVDVDGWLCSVYPQRRICWIPVSCRPKDLAFSGSLVALGTADGRVVILDLQNLPPTPLLLTKYAPDDARPGA